MTTAHAPFPPSAAKRWMTCTGSFALGLQAPPEKESVYAAEGSRLHTVAAAVLDPKAPRADDATQEDLQAVRPYTSYIAKRTKKCDHIAIEQHIYHSQLLSGTPDALMVEKDLMEVVDLKNGAGILVDPTENHQMLTYAYMALAALKQTNVHPTKIRLTVVQPPDEAQPVKSWDTTSGRVMLHGIEAEKAIETAITGQGELVPGDHCRFCRAKSICPKLRGEVVEGLGGALPGQMTLHSLASWLDRADRMEQFINSVREVGHSVAALAQELGTDPIPGWKLKPKRATRTWADEEAVMRIARRRKIKIWQDKLLSPAMAEKAHPNMPDDLRQQIVAVSSGVNLVRMTPAEVEARALEVKRPDEATQMERMMANMSVAKLRR